jgi:rubrerythrin
MKWAVLILAILFPLISLAAEPRTPFGVQKILTNAVIGERQAIARYNAYAAKADEEGYLGAASLFRACAKAESIHLRRFTALMIERNLAVPAEATVKVDVASTAENLENAFAAENAERDSTYLYAIRQANDDHDEAVAKTFDETRDVEVEHANLCAGALRNLADMKTAREYYVCERCGYTTNVRLPLCPSCRDAHPLHGTQ